ncbi:DUF3090 domain-containing protein [soil metagenome]
MTRRIFDFDPPDRFLAGAVGEPGQRVFYLQVSKGSAVVSVALEKAQVSALAQRLAELVDEVRQRGGDLPAAEGLSIPQPASLEEPLVEQFRVGTMALAWDTLSERVVVEARAMQEEEEDPGIELQDDDPDGPDVLRVHLAADTALAFAERAVQLVASGRPPCPFCGQPLNSEGHLCPRRNGYVN